MTLALLLSAVTGAWAQATFGVKEITADMVPASWNGDNSVVTPQDLAGLGITFVETTLDQAKAWANHPTTGGVRLLYAYNESFLSANWQNGTQNALSSGYNRKDIYDHLISSTRVFVTIATEPPIEVNPVAEPAANTKQWTFTQPGGNVVLTPQYAPTAVFATDGNNVLAPAAVEGAVAGTDDPLIKEGTGTVAFAGTSTTVRQGQVMYAVTSTNQATAPALTSSDWKNTVPTAKNVADNGAEVKVWYYIQGADTPQGQTPTKDNTFNDSEICTTPLTVTVRSNKFDLAFMAANANTIESGKATVTVDGTDKTSAITNGQLTGIKMGSEVKMTAAQGYKFRKVEVKKGIEKTITITDTSESISTTLDIAGCTTWDEVITKNSDQIKKDGSGNILDKNESYMLYRGESLVNASNEVAPNATDYLWVPGR